MGKHRDEGNSGNSTRASMEEDLSKDSSSSPHKKHKKHKHKKHKHKRSHNSPLRSPETYLSAEPVLSDSSGKPQLKLKIKIGGQSFGTKSYNKVTSPHFTSEEDEEDEDDDEGIDDELEEDEQVVDEEIEPVNVVQDEDEEDRFTPWQDQTPPVSHHGSENPDEEEAWLDALEAGQLDSYGEIKRVKDPSLLTARQRAMLHGLTVEEEKQLLQLPSGAKTPEMTEEMLEKKAEKAQKRRAQAHKKIEEHKKQTIARLLKKQDSKLKGMKSRLRQGADRPRMHYVNNTRGIMLSLPAGMDYPLEKQVGKPPKPQAICGLTGCSNPMKYSCSTTGIPLCSLECYKRNLSHQAVPCAS